jgi:hypothetical protein
MIIGNNFEDFQQLEAIVTYSDIGGKTYKKEFRVDFRMSIMNLDESLIINQQENLIIELYPSFHQIKK